MNFWVKQIRSSLETFETQLNSSSGHFIFELLQNADDNDYDPGVTPTFEMKLSSSPDGHTFHTSCNESGFSIEQIDSLCEIGYSTKKHQKNIDGGYIGEKGLGFKSVFSVADVVYVSSGFYSFKLDKTQPMGEFMPMPSPFPAPQDTDEKHCSTRMMLQIRKNHVVVERSFHNITPEMLLFLRRLRRIQIDSGAYKSVFIATRNDYDDKFLGETRTVKTWKDPGQVETTTKYIISRDIVENMPEEDKRKAVTVSEVALGFPLGCDNKADARPQYAFSFIPFQKAGFHVGFLIQADFILVASRESLNLDNRWNQKLRRAIPETFEKAVHRFINAESELRYTWPEYLGHDTLVDEFWRELETLIVKHLGNLAILQSRAAGDDCFQKPGDLVFIPPEYRLDGKALIDCPDQRRRQLAFEYTTDNTLSPGLKRLGVRKMGLHEFIDTFCEWIAKREPTFLDNMTKEWHEKIADLFLQGGSAFKPMLQKIPIVPTITGEWVSATEKGLCCVSEQFVHGVPSSLGLRIVAYSARLEPKREELFRFLGIKALSGADICNGIVDLHREEDRRPRAQLVEETTYLFLHRNAIKTPKFRHLRLWFATRNEPACKRGYSAYVIDPEIKPNVVEKLHSNNEAFIYVIHQEHIEHVSRAMEAGEGQENGDCSTKDDLKGRRRAARDIFFDWLEDYCGVAKIPRLVIQNRLSLEGRFLLQKKPCLLLQLLRDEWSVYEKDRTVLEKSLRRLAILCTDGMWRNLEDTAVPTMVLKKACPHLSFASLPEPENRNWAMLSNFSVITDPGITAHVRELKDLRAKERKSIDLEDPRRIYQHLAGNDANEVRRSIE
ncbi:heterokaryon incompatibility [Colletotrichum musicola]|uniref:Heterokaryon incompatibility n=1 Tax=Colletotrichum musicola TaxID=2175873 RepID=A0A8H6NPG2_9PEZI|nr:heterokaryon incompatibility [Colletotrichum musicola]